MTANDQLPKNFKLVTVFAIMIGVMGVLGGLSGAASVLSGGQKVADIFSFEQPDPEMQRVQEKMMAESVKLTDQWRIPNGIMAMCNLLLSSAMIAGGILTGRVRRDGRRLLSKVFLISIIYDPIVLIPTLILTSKTMAIQQQMSGEMMGAIGRGSSAEVAETAKNVASVAMTVSLYMGIAFAIGWVGIKVWFYVWARKRLAKPDVDELFAQYGS